MKTTLSHKMCIAIAERGPLTRKELLTIIGRPARRGNFSSYFAPVDHGVINDPETARRLKRRTRASLVASGKIVAVGKIGRELVYALTPMGARVTTAARVHAATSYKLNPQ